MLYAIKDKELAFGISTPLKRIEQIFEMLSLMKSNL
jgi:hypothetical protein